ncbi:MAG: NAD(P)/FAD-dependent oxidoreductase [Acidiferrobacter sp.]
MRSRPRVIVVGAGFAGLAAVRALAHQAIDVLWIDRNNYHVFQPLLYQVATGSLDPETIAAPLRRCARRWPNVRVLWGEVTALDLARRTVTADTGTHPYDYLILATGSTTNFFQNSELARYAHDLKGLVMSMRVQSAVLRILERAAAQAARGEVCDPITCVVVGGGPTGVEYAAALSDLLHRRLSGDYPELHLAIARVTLLQAGGALLPTFPQNAQDHARAVLESQAVSLRLHARVEHYDGRTVRLSSGESLDTPLLVWAAGVCATPLMATLSVDKGPGGRIKVTDHLQLPGHPEVFVVGDMAYRDDRSWPQNAPFAQQSGVFAAYALLRARDAPPQRPFCYRELGSMVALRRFDAVVSLPWLGICLWGPAGWFIWFIFHIGVLVGFRNRVAALFDWGTDLISRSPVAGLILSGSSSDDPSKNNLGPP